MIYEDEGRQEGGISWGAGLPNTVDWGVEELTWILAAACKVKVQDYAAYEYQCEDLSGSQCAYPILHHGRPV